MHTQAWRDALHVARIDARVADFERVALFDQGLVADQILSCYTCRHFGIS